MSTSRWMNYEAYPATFWGLPCASQLTNFQPSAFAAAPMPDSTRRNAAACRV